MRKPFTRTRAFLAFEGRLRAPWLGGESRGPVWSLAAAPPFTQQSSTETPIRFLTRDGPRRALTGRRVPGGQSELGDPAAERKSVTSCAEQAGADPSHQQADPLCRSAYPEEEPTTLGTQAEPPSSSRGPLALGRGVAVDYPPREQQRPPPSPGGS